MDNKLFKRIPLWTLFYWAYRKTTTGTNFGVLSERDLLSLFLSSSHYITFQPILYQPKKKNSVTGQKTSKPRRCEKKTTPSSSEVFINIYNIANLTCEILKLYYYFPFYNEGTPNNQTHASNCAMNTLAVQWIHSTDVIIGSMEELLTIHRGLVYVNRS